MGYYRGWPDPPAGKMEFDYKDGDTVLYQSNFYRYQVIEWCEEEGVSFIRRPARY